MCQENNYYSIADAGRRIAYKIVIKGSDSINKWSSEYRNFTYVKGETYKAKGASPLFREYDQLTGGVFHVYLDLKEARRKQGTRSVVLLKVEVSDYVASGRNGSYETACYLRLRVLGSVPKEK